MSFKDEVRGKKVLVFGLGIQGGGLGDALWLHKHGAIVRVTDAKNADQLQGTLTQLPAGIETSIGGHSTADIEWADVIIKNPGVPDTEPLLKTAKERHIPVLTSIAIFVQEARDKVIGVTGTRGKSTTTELIYRILDAAYPGQIIRGGNIPGTSGLSSIDQIDNKKYAVLELSSFQLHNFHELRISPHIAVLTNIYPDHLNRYPSMVEYQEDKRAIVAYQTSGDYMVVNQSNTGVQEMAASAHGRLVSYSAADVPADWKLHILGEHNRENIGAAIATARILDIKQELVKNIVEDFHGLPFRLEEKVIKGNIHYINDTTSTTPIATVKAIGSMKRPTTIIVGGETKGLPIQDMVDTLATSDSIKKIVILGSKNNRDFVESLKKSAGAKVIGQVFSMHEAVERATQVSEKGWNVLLSPGFASFDLFQNEFDRGRQFNDVVDAL